MDLLTLETLREIIKNNMKITYFCFQENGSHLKLNDKV